MITEIKMYTAHCDGCGTQWVGYDEYISAMAEKEYLKEELENSEWHMKESTGQTYCSDCYEINDEDKVVFKTAEPNKSSS